MRRGQLDRCSERGSRETSALQPHSDRRWIMTDDDQTQKPIENYHCDTANDFLDMLSPRCERLWKGNAKAWIFRGHGDAAWKLQPAAVRDFDTLRELGRDAPENGAGEELWSRRGYLLKEMLAQFQEGLDKSGVPIPSSSPVLRPRNVYTTSAEPEREAFPLMALAQHHGLPTLLLDWSRRAWVAAYFAAVQATQIKHDPGPKLAVWALLKDGLSDDNCNGIRLYEAPGWTNPNLRAQGGLFTLLTRVDDMDLERFIAVAGGPSLRRLTLPRTQVPALLRLLSEEGIDGSSMFPGADGVVRAMRERVLWSL